MNQTLYAKYKAVMPEGAGALFSIQIFSTLSYSVFYSTLILYATNALKMDDLLATSVTGSFVALNYFLHLIGGYIGGRWVSYRSAFTLGITLLMLGCLVFSLPSLEGFYWGLAIFLSGAGMISPSINCMVTQLFEPNDKRRETAFLWIYSGMNIGFFVGFLLSGFFHLRGGYQVLFLIGAFSNFISLILILYFRRLLNDRDTAAALLTPKQKQLNLSIAILTSLILIFCIRSLLEQASLCNKVILSVGALTFVFLAFLSFQQTTLAVRQKMWGFIILSLASLIFWALYQLAPMGLNLFIERNVDRHYLGMLLAPQWVQNINTVIIIVGGPLLASFFSRLRERGISINIPFQFALALLLIGCAYSLIPLGIKYADVNGLVNFNWILISYFLQSCGELFISPIGYAMVGELAPQRLRGIMTGMWMMLVGMSAILSNQFSKMALGSTDAVNPIITNPSFSHTFGILGASSIAAGVLMLFFVPFIAKLTQEKKSSY